MTENESADFLIKLAGGLPETDLADTFSRNNRLQIPGILDGLSANAIYDSLTNFQHWNLVFNKSGTHVDSNASDVAAWRQTDRDKLEDIIHSQASNDFQYYYETVPIYDAYHKALLPGHFINRIFEFLNSKEFLALMRTVTGDDSIAFADAQATCYKKGHFLTRHDDDVSEKSRRAAYVLSLSRDWNPDWGGALQFFDAKGNIECGYVPTFNALNLFRIPASHSVGLVAPFAKTGRYSITGWLRSGRDPMLAN
jgi:SM-20-related protein